MLQKALEARALYIQSREPVLPVTRAGDESSFIVGQTKLVNNLDNFDPSTPRPSHSGSNQGTAASTSNYGSSSALHQPEPVSGSQLDSNPAMLGDVSGGWDSLFYERPQPSYQHLAGKAGNSNLTDSMAPFMNYGVLMEPSFFQPHPSQPQGEFDMYSSNWYRDVYRML